MVLYRHFCLTIVCTHIFTFQKETLHPSQASLLPETTVCGQKEEQLVPDYPHWRYPGMSEWDVNQNTSEVKFETPEPSRVNYYMT